MARIHNGSITETIGNTPSCPPEPHGCRRMAQWRKILLKLEFFNPLSSAKVFASGPR
jgi:cysteine synthase